MYLVDPGRDICTIALYISANLRKNRFQRFALHQRTGVLLLTDDLTKGTNHVSKHVNCDSMCAHCRMKSELVKKKPIKVVNC